MFGIRRAKKAAAVAGLCAAAFALSGCGASLSVFAFTQNGVRYNDYALTIDSETVELMESSAALDPNGVPYTVPEYFYALFSEFGFEIVESRRTPSAFSAVYRKAFKNEPAETGGNAAFVTGSRLLDIANQINYSQDITSNPFVRHIKLVSPDPFNGVRAAYDGVRPGQSVTVIQRVKNGIKTRDGVTDEIIVTMPSIVEAFPYLDGLDAGGLRLDYLVSGSSRMSSSGTSVEGDGYSTYRFSRYFDDAERTIEFDYDRPQQYGWYLVALAAGGITIAAFVLATRPKRQKPTLLDRFPYNPEEFRDYDNHLPMNK